MNGGRILVAGSTGRVGEAAARRFLEAGFAVRALVRRADKGERLRALGAEVAVGDVTAPETLEPALEGCSGVFSALAAGPGRGDAETVEHNGNVNLLRAASASGAGRFVYVSALMADHPLAQSAGEFREKARFERELAGSGVSFTILRPAMLMETLLIALRGSVAVVIGPQRLPASWVCADDVARAALSAFERGVEGRYDLAGPDLCTFDEGYARLARVRGGRIRVLHVPLAAVRLPSLFVPHVRDLARMFEFFDRAGYAADPAPLREVFGVEAVNLEEWARRLSGRGSLG